jgi:alpha-D-xyloside xylohydrolase
MFWKENDKLIYCYDAEKLWIEPWGENASRIRATKDNIMPPEDWALMKMENNDARIWTGLLAV